MASEIISFRSFFNTTTAGFQATGQHEWFSCHDLPAWESNKAVRLTHLPSLTQGVYLLKVMINGQEFNEKIVRY